MDEANQTACPERSRRVLAYMSFPSQHRLKLHSTNPLERLNGESKRRHRGRWHLPR